MALFPRHRPLPLLLVILVDASLGSPSSGDSYNSSLCLRQPQRCGGVNISYPFYLYDETANLLGYSSSYCGYPGMEILCEDDGEEQAILQLDGHNYTVSSIDYNRLTVTVADQEVQTEDSCPKVDHNVTFPPASWLSYPNTTVDYLFFFLGCSITVEVAKSSYNIDPITCQIFEGAGLLSFVLPQHEVPPGNLSKTCQGGVFSAPVFKHDLPAPGDPLGIDWRNGGYGGTLRHGFQLAWDQKPAACDKCERSEGQCGYRETGEFVGCLCSGGRVNPHNCSSGVI